MVRMRDPSSMARMRMAETLKRESGRDMVAICGGESEVRGRFWRALQQRARSVGRSKLSSSSECRGSVDAVGDLIGVSSAVV